ncbi:MAG: LysM peptidoglycan-binding domain-containing protein, partial [Actinomycetota bacterium]|nr:LysM peptidoglycan-binding domain-containing protein [Actinomycetota bacterium]
MVRARGSLVLVAVVATVLAGQAAAGPGRPGGAATRVVVAGETLSSVAASLGVSVSSLAKANGITDVNRLRAGSRLVVPGKAPARPRAVPRR